MTQQAMTGGRLSDSAPPLHSIVRERMTEAILTGEWPPGTVLPNEIALAQRFGVATGTLRRALKDLTDEGMLSRRRKSGTVVTGRAPRHSLRFLFRFFRLHDADGALVEAEVRNLALFRGPAGDDEARDLALAPGAEVAVFERLRLVDAVPVMLDRFVLATARFPGLAEEVTAMPDLLYLHLQQRHGLVIAAVRERLSAVAAGPAGAALGLAPDAPVLLIEETAYDGANVPVILATHHADTRRYRYVNELR